MRYSTAHAVMLAALSIGDAVAGPTHAHLHRHAHEKKDVDWAALDWNNMGIDWVSAYKAGQAAKTAAPAAVPAATPAPAAAAPAAAAPAAAGKSTASSAEGLWNGVVGASNGRTAFGGASASSGVAGDNYVGNVGEPYGSNIIKVDSTEGYSFTNEFLNPQGTTITVNIWNKVGSDGQVLSGSALAPKDTSLTFTLAPGESQVVAFAEDSQVAWAQATDALTESGAFATTWGEANFHSSGSGYDVSAILNAGGNNYAMAISTIEAPDCVSDNTQNFWLTASEPIGTSDGSCYVAQNTATLKTKLGGTI